MRNLILFLIVLFSAQNLLADTPVEACMARAKDHTAFTRDGAYKDCAQFATTVDECITISTKLTRLSQDQFLADQCLSRTSSYAECSRVANRVSVNPGVKDHALSECNRNYPQSK